MNIVDEKLGTVFCVSHKCASSSVSAALKHIHGDRGVNHLKEAKSGAELSGYRMEGYKVIAFVRDPFNRVYSAWKGWAEPRNIAGSFEDFLLFVEDTADEHCNAHIQSQHIGKVARRRRFGGNKDGAIAYYDGWQWVPEHTYPIETLERSKTHRDRFLGYEFPILHLNEHSKPYGVLKTKYRKLIAEMYRKDVEFLEPFYGYDLRA